MTQVVIGIGSNVGNRWQHILDAVQCLRHAGFREITVASLYENAALLPADALPEWNMPFLNTAVRVETDLSPSACLQQLKIIEKTLGRKDAPRWSPRVIDLDLLVWGGECIQTPELHIPHPCLSERYFALRPLAELLPDWVFPEAVGMPLAGKTAMALVSEIGYAAAQGNLFAPHTQLVGVLNVTPDSFSDGGRYVMPSQAVKQAEALMVAGASVIDIGAQSTGPSAPQIGAEKEWERLAPVLSALPKRTERTACISIDTYHADVARKAIETFDVDWINDVSGGRNADLLNVVAGTGKMLVLMHSLTLPALDAEILAWETDPVSVVCEWAEQKLRVLERLGITSDRVILDPGIGFGKTGFQSILLLKHIQRLKAYGVKLLVGHSRKSFMQTFTVLPPEDREPESLAISTWLLQQSVDFIRVHQVDWHRRNLAAAYAIMGPW